MARKGEGRVTKSFGIPVSKITMYEEFEKISTREGKSASEIITELIESYTEIHKDGNSQHLLTSFQKNVDFYGFPASGISLTEKQKFVHNVLPKQPKLRQKLIEQQEKALTDAQQWIGLCKNE